MSNSKTELLQVAEITAGPVITLERMVIRFDFLAPDERGNAVVQKGASYALTVDQARYLIEQAARTLQVLESVQMSPSDRGPVQ